MIILLSPAKMLDFSPAPEGLELTKPGLFAETKKLSDTTRQLSRSDLKRMMGISDALVDLNYERFQAFKKTAIPKAAKQAVLTFNGDVYRGLEATSFSKDDLAFAQDHLRMLSGLYGLLRPLDAIQPYRLEMGSKLKTERGKTLYDYWKGHIAAEINKTLAGSNDPFVLCLASNEYAKSVDRRALKMPMITPVFKEEKDGKSRALMLYAKQARGMMARWIIQNRVTKLADIKKFDVGGYRFQTDQSDDLSWTFSRPQPAPKKAA